jgi:hypothetical protein
MRTRLTVLAMGLSLALNVFLGIALFRASHVEARPAPAPPPAPCNEEERLLREQLEAQLCAEPFDCAAVEATFQRLDALRAAERVAALDRWVYSGKQTECRSGEMSPEVQRLLCPWKQPAS